MPLVLATVTGIMAPNLYSLWTFDDAGHSGFVESVNLACVASLLPLRALIKVGGLLIGQRFRRRLATQFANKNAADGPQVFTLSATVGFEADGLQKRFDFALVTAPEVDVFELCHGVETRRASGQALGIRG